MNEEEKKEEDQKEIRKSGLAYAAAFSLFVTVAVFLGVGWLVDKWTGKSPLFLVLGIVFGSALGLYEFYRVTKKLSE